MTTPFRLLSLVPVLVLTACVDERPPLGSDDVAETADSAVTVDEGELTDEDSGPGCMSDEDCVGNSDGPLCDTNSGQCFPSCIPGDSETCYDGPEDTAQIGICTIGSRACQADGTWGGCTDQVLPELEDCENGLDDDCDGMTDATDADGDGFYSCIEGELADCCDDEIFGCIDAHLVNPGAYEVPGNEVDDDCDGETDEVTPTCDGGLISSSSDPMAYARALDLCATTTEDGFTWGVIDGSFARADGSSTPIPSQRSIRPEFGDGNPPFMGETMVVLSSGTAAAPGQSAPSFGAFEPGTEYGSNANPNAVPTPVAIPTCDGAASDGQANDSIRLHIRVRVPTNARSFTTKFAFFSAEFPEWVCSQYNDAFVAVLTSEADNDVPDGNIAVYDAMDGNPPWPIGVNMASLTENADIPLFTNCRNGIVGCQAGAPFPLAKCASEMGLINTGFDVVDSSNSCNPGDLTYPVGGGTGWLEMAGNVVPGEVITLDFAIWDAGGYKFDSLVLLDDWQWSLDAASPGVQLP